MREIKFRVWYDADEEYKAVGIENIHRVRSSMLEWEHLKKVNSAWFASLMRGEFKGYHLMQFTSLKDKNGKDIYEGDIVKGKIIETKESFKAVVEFNESGYWLFEKRLPTGTKQSIDMSSYVVKDLEVIGNIYENPEKKVQL